MERIEKLKRFWRKMEQIVLCSMHWHGVCKAEQRQRCQRTVGGAPGQGRKLCGKLLSPGKIAGAAGRAAAGYKHVPKRHGGSQSCRRQSCVQRTAGGLRRPDLLNTSTDSFARRIHPFSRGKNPGVCGSAIPACCQRRVGFGGALRTE
jgi:hypothetical protein